MAIGSLPVVTTKPSLFGTWLPTVSRAPLTWGQVINQNHWAAYARCTSRFLLSVCLSYFFTGLVTSAFAKNLWNFCATRAGVLPRTAKAPVKIDLLIYKDGREPVVELKRLARIPAVARKRR